MWSTCLLVVFHWSESANRENGWWWSEQATVLCSCCYWYWSSSATISYGEIWQYRSQSFRHFRMITRTRVHTAACCARSVSFRCRIFPVTFRFSVVRGVITRFYGYVSFALNCTVHTSLPHHTKSLEKQQNQHSTMGKEKVHVSLVVIGHVDAGEFTACCVKALVEPLSLCSSDECFVGFQKN